MVQICHLTIHGIKIIEVAVGTGGVCQFRCLLVAFKSLRGFAHVMIDTPQKVMSTHALVGVAVSVVIIHHFLHHDVGRHRAISLVQGIGQEKLVAHTELHPEPHPDLPERRRREGGRMRKRRKNL